MFVTQSESYRYCRRGLGRTPLFLSSRPDLSLSASSPDLPTCLLVRAATFPP